MTLGDRIRTARLEKNLTVEQLSALSRVSIKNIISFEDNNFSVDARVFVQANLNAIASVLELELSEELAQENILPPTLTMNVFDKDGSPLQRRNYTPLVMAIGLVLLFAIILYGLFTRTPGTSEPLPEITITSSPSSTASEIPSISNGVEVVLVAESRSWLSVKSSSNQVIFERIMETGEQLSFTDAISLTVTVGNAAGVNITVNDENIGYLGGIGQVVSQIFTSPSSTD